MSNYTTAADLSKTMKTAVLKQQSRVLAVDIARHLAMTMAGIQVHSQQAGEE
jgi:hypothetical protein